MHSPRPLPQRVFGGDAFIFDFWSHYRSAGEAPPSRTVAAHAAEQLAATQDLSFFIAALKFHAIHSD